MQEIELNYPIKYCAMPIYENNQVSAYIATKCYLVEHTTKYLRNETLNIYKIVYYYSDSFKKIYPILKNEEYINSITTEVLFDDLESAQRYARVKNNQLLYKRVSNLSDIDMNEKRKELYDKYYELETMLFDESEKSNIVDIKTYKKIKKVGR